MTAKLTDAERNSALATLSGWHRLNDRDAIAKSFQFESFTIAFAFMTAVAIEAEKADHHPEWFNVYNRVDITLSTHDACGLTHRDIGLAEVTDRLAATFTRG